MMEKFDIKISTARALELETKREIPGLSFYIPYKYLIYFLHYLGET